VDIDSLMAKLPWLSTYQTTSAIGLQPSKEIGKLTSIVYIHILLSRSGARFHFHMCILVT
jgi:hypothetical protein